MTLQTPCLLYSSKTQRLMPFLDQKTTATCLRFSMDNRSFKYKTAFYNQIDPDGQLSQSQIYTQDTDFEGKMQPRQIQKQLREQKVPVTIMSSINSAAQHWVAHAQWDSRPGGGEDQEPDAKAQKTCGASRGQQKAGVTVGRAYALPTTQSTFSPFLVRVWRPSFTHIHGPTVCMGASQVAQR